MVRTLADRLKAVRRRRFESLVREHVGAVNAYALALTADPWLADDAVQETFLRAWKYQDSFRGTGSYEGWLLRICRNTVIDQATHRGSERSSLTTTGLDVDDVIDHSAGNSVRSVEIDEAIAALPVIQREVIALCGVLGYDYEAAAAVLGVPVGTIRSRLHRARSALAATLDTDTEQTGS
jgi:RNA polymerase sigma-70 factor (ECF subfamily)